MKGRKRSFSLLELCCSLSVLGVLSTCLSWQIRDFYLGHRFQEEVKTLLIDLRLAQSLALSYHTDFEVAFNRDPAEGKWSYTTSTDEGIAQFTKKQKKTFESVEKISFTGPEKTPLSFTLTFSECSAPQGALSLEGRKKLIEVDLRSSALSAAKDPKKKGKL